MREYCYAFKENGQECYHVYAPSKVLAIAKYLKERELESLPKTTMITRSNI